MPVYKEPRKCYVLVQYPCIGDNLLSCEEMKLFQLTSNYIIFNPTGIIPVSHSEEKRLIHMWYSLKLSYVHLCERPWPRDNSSLLLISEQALLVSVPACNSKLYVWRIPLVLALFRTVTNTHIDQTNTQES